ncbi:unnamed protein product [Lupinus luteus]|uniref:DUF8040 domain-containing protein n=1 Tax=Lupinus luteus TaxID=3873 RepID=A0AAV1W2S7_LUPLU
MRHRVVAERFQHSLQTVSKWFKRVLRAVCKLGRTIIIPRNQSSTHPYIRRTQKYFPYFKKSLVQLMAHMYQLGLQHKNKHHFVEEKF